MVRLRLDLMIFKVFSNLSNSMITFGGFHHSFKWVVPAGDDLCRERPGGHSGGQKVGHELLWPRRPIVSWGCIKKNVASRLRDVVLPLYLCPGETTFRMLHPILGSLVQKWQESPRRSPAEGYKDYRVPGSFPVWGYPERLCSLLLWSYLRPIWMPKYATCCRL